MIAVSLKGLWGRKLRTLLTALAIVLGVSMISGTYVLTDSITAAFTKIVDHGFTNSDAVISGKVAFKNDDSNTGEGVVPAFPASVLTKVKQLPDVAAAAGEVGDEAKLLGRDGKVISTGGGGSIGSSVDPANDAKFNPLKLVAGQWPVGGGQIAIDKHTADTKHFAVGDTIGVAANAGVRRFEITGIAKYARQRVDRRSDDRDLRRPHRPEAVLEGRQVRRDPGVGQGRGHARAAREPDQATAACDRAGEDLGGADGRCGRRRPRLARDHAEVPARLRRHRAVRRGLRDLEHAVDHHRAARAGVRNAPDDRRLAPAGAAHRPAGGVRRRCDRVCGRALRRTGDRKGPERAVRRHRRRVPEGRHRHCDPHDRRQPAGRDRGDPARQPPARRSRRHGCPRSPRCARVRRCRPRACRASGRLPRW